MNVTDSIQEARSEILRMRRPLGLVPSMGFLHQGHMALVHRARMENATLAVSIFVNPLQFGPQEDYAAYPRDMESDLSKLKDAGVDLVFAPPKAEIYPNGFDTHVDVGWISKRLEGTSRPGHFEGVATIICKLFSIIRPDSAYFGQKDVQQCLAASRLNADLNLGTEIVVVPTVREGDGLALSSRNAYLGREERRSATVLYRALCLGRSLRDQGVTSGTEIVRQMRALMESEPMAEIDYVSVADADTLEELDHISGPALALVAARFGKARLIDNMVL